LFRQRSRWSSRKTRQLGKFRLETCDGQRILGADGLRGRLRKTAPHSLCRSGAQRLAHGGVLTVPRIRVIDDDIGTRAHPSPCAGRSRPRVCASLSAPSGWYGEARPFHRPAGRSSRRPRAVVVRRSPRVLSLPWHGDWFRRRGARHSRVKIYAVRRNFAESRRRNLRGSFDRFCFVDRDCLHPSRAQL
jgi:hypothetical protein